MALGSFMAYTGDPYEIVSRLESLGEAEVRRLLGTREFGDPGSITRSVVEDWLRRKESEATLSIAREANSIARKARSEARRANIIAIIAMILSTIIAIAATIIEISKP